MNNISPLAYIHPEATIGKNCEIGPFCYVDKNVIIGDNNVLMNSVSILYGARIGDGNIFFPGAVISAIPQDLKFVGEETTAEIGNDNKIRENVTINRGTQAKGKTIVGSNNLLMEGMHVGHDVIIGDGCIIGNSTKLGGEVIIDDNAILSAGVLVHQFCRIGGYTMVGGGSKVNQNILPFTMTAREPPAFCGLNIVGLRRRGYTPEVIEQLHHSFNIIMKGEGLLAERVARVKNEIGLTPETTYILNFIKDTEKRGFIR